MQVVKSYNPLLLSVLLIGCTPLHAQGVPNSAVSIYDNSYEIFQPVVSSHGMVATEQRLASQVGADILKQGGNATDAAVAIGFTLAVVLPNAGNLGGGGFMLVHDAKATQTEAIDFRETAPSAASRDMYLDASGKVIAGKSTITRFAVGVPGTVAGLTYALEKHGSMPIARVVAPAIQLAEEGFIVSPVLAEQFKLQRDHLGRWPGSRGVFFKAKSTHQACQPDACDLNQVEPLQAGDRLKQPDLAKTLGLIADKGAAAFYQGDIAQKIVTEVNQDGNVMSLDDLAHYQIQSRQPVRGSYRGVDVLSMPAPSSGGIHLIEMLNLLEYFQLSESGFGSAQSIHLLTEAARLAYADRSEYLGDPAFYKVPQIGLTSKGYAQSLIKKINPNKATASKDTKPGLPLPYESDQTTHFSVMDKNGNVVSTTYTLNLNFGSGMVARGTGVLLNNEMDDFSVKPGVPNAFGLVGGQANAIEAGKRPLSSMTPVIAFKNGKPWIATGSPGGSRIITTVLQNLVNVIDYQMNIAEAAAMPRMHHQWVPDVLRLERGFSPDTIKILKGMGHDVKVQPTMGRIQTVQFENGMYWGSSDPRNPDGAAIGVEVQQ
jgi:gamma-glutamyltranspeptidase/glutathione hydrolase